jgi:hypothetical protein
MKENRGGCIISRPLPINYTPGCKIGFTCISDLHLGAANVDEELIKDELEEAKRNNDRININGDIFDMILIKDVKRFQPDVLHPKLYGRKDIVNACLDMAENLLGPYANQIDMIGQGNHDLGCSKHHNVDVIKLLIERLEKHHKPSHKIHYGNITGFIDYRLRYVTPNGQEGNGHGKRFVIYYHHGTGGGSPLNKGTIDLHKKAWVEADLIWLGHKHTKVSTEVRTMKCPQSGVEPLIKDVRQIITGAYMDLYSGQTQESIKEQGPKLNYAAESGWEPMGKGGARIVLSFGKCDQPYKIKVTH